MSSAINGVDSLGLSTITESFRSTRVMSAKSTLPRRCREMTIAPIPAGTSGERPASRSARMERIRLYDRSTWASVSAADISSSSWSTAERRSRCASMASLKLMTPALRTSADRASHRPSPAPTVAMKSSTSPVVATGSGSRTNPRKPGGNSAVRTGGVSTGAPPIQ
jgi:hypothetical protein